MNNVINYLDKYFNLKNKATTTTLTIKEKKMFQGLHQWYWNRNIQMVQGR